MDPCDFGMAIALDQRGLPFCIPVDGRVFALPHLFSTDDASSDESSGESDTEKTESTLGVPSTSTIIKIKLYANHWLSWARELY